MKRIFIFLSLFVTSFSLFASELVCKGQTESYQIQLEQIDDGVTATMRNLKPYKYTDAQTPEDGKYKVTGINTSSVTIHNIDLSTLLLKPRLAEEAIVKMLFGRRELDGEYDMVYYYASEIFHAAKCD